MITGIATVDLSAAQARRIALAAQGLDALGRDARVDRRQGRRLIRDLGAIQIDSVNVLCRSQELPLLARLGPHPRDLIARLTAAGDIFEYWGHEASHMPVELQPLLRWRMHDARVGIGTWGSVAAIAREEPGLVAAILRQVEDAGTLTTRDIDHGGPRAASMWGWSPAKRALEYLFWSGTISARRGPNFERVYGLSERMLPPAVVATPTPSRDVAHRELLMIAARAFGVATAADLADYFRLHVPTARRLLQELADDGALATAQVEGWRERAYLHPAARRPRRVRVRALLSPFDSLVWNRARTERIWGFRYRVEIYVPRERRVHGYYVLPFLLDGDLVARVDLKADRPNRRLLVQSAHGEPGSDTALVAFELAGALARLAAFLGLDEVTVAGAGDLADPLRHACR